MIKNSCKVCMQWWTFNVALQLALVNYGKQSSVRLLYQYVVFFQMVESYIQHPVFIIDYINVRHTVAGGNPMRSVMRTDRRLFAGDCILKHKYKEKNKQIALTISNKSVRIFLCVWLWGFHYWCARLKFAWTSFDQHSRVNLILLCVAVKCHPTHWWGVGQNLHCFYGGQVFKQRVITSNNSVSCRIKIKY